MTPPDGKDKIDRDYREAVARIEKMAAQELQRVRDKAGQVKLEAQAVGERVERSIRNREA